MNVHQPLAHRLRPKALVDFCGQSHIWQPTLPLWLLAHSGNFYSLIFWGPSGSGKTTLAQLMANHLKIKFLELSCVNAGVKEIRACIEESSHNILMKEKPILLFLDEIHRLSKNQQDVLLPALENGTIKMIGATTENPSFQVNKSILSRSICFAFQPHSKSEIKTVIEKALAQLPSLNPPLKLSLDQSAMDLLADSCEGDARSALNLVEVLLHCLPQDKIIDAKSVLNLGIDQLRKASYDQHGDSHYDVISAFIKSLRASHPDAAFHYLARMIDAGEDPLFIARRLIIFASEDIGNASPTALMLAQSALQAIKDIGMPEGRIILGQVTALLASSPKSNRSYVAINQALADLKKKGPGQVPIHLRNAVSPLMKDLGYGKAYHYPHDDNRYLEDDYLPDEYRGAKYYEPSSAGTEAQLKEHLKRLRPNKD